MFARSRNFIFAGLLMQIVLMLSGCMGEGGSLGLGRACDSVVINELMLSNRTGLLAPDGKTRNWVELKNLSASRVELRDYTLAVASHADSDADSEWTLPDTAIAGGGSLLVYFSKKGGKGKAGMIFAKLKLGKKGGYLRLLRDGDIMDQVKYTDMPTDQSLSRREDGSYEKTYMQTPGFNNTKEGYEQYNVLIDSQRKDPLLIWEVMSRAERNTANWVELKNVGDTAVDLSQYTLSSKKGKEWQLPDKKLAAGQTVVIQMAGRNANRFNLLHATIKMGNAETVMLTKDGHFVDGVCAKPTIIGTSIGRTNGRKGFFFFASPSRGMENTGPHRFIAEQPRLDREAGIYNKVRKLVLRLDSCGRVVHYTLDGSEPTASSPVWRDSLIITKSTVVRAYAEGDSATLRSSIMTASYLINEKHSLPVLCVSMNSADLYDYNRGIYAQGPGYSPQWPHLGANFWKSWTKNAHVEFFDDREGFSTDCGIKIFGGYSRIEAKKSFCLKFKNTYGAKELTYDFFDQGKLVTLSNLVLRSGSQDYNRCMVRDEFFTSLMAEQSPTLLTQPYRPVALYINAEYFGLYYLRDKIDRDFVAQRLGVSNDSITILMSMGYQEEGNNREYNRLMNFITSRSMAEKDNYEYVKDRVDLQGLIDYKLGEIYSSNTDVGNIRYVRSTDEGSDKKWHFVFYDLDATWVGYKPTASFYLSVGANSDNQVDVSVHNRMINRLLANRDFRQLFMERLSHHLHNTFSTKNATAVFDALVKTVRPEMKRNCERWPQLRYDTWEKNIVKFREKFAVKNRKMLNDLRQLLSITEEENKRYFYDLGY